MLKHVPGRSLIIWLILLLAMVSPVHLLAQDTDIITIYLPPYLRDSVPQDVFASFEEQTGYQVQQVDADPARLPSPYELGQAISDEAHDTDYFETAQQLAQTADVIFLTEEQLHPYLTRTGVLLNLEPFLRTDTQYTDAPLLPGLDTAFTWDGGTWALPVTATLELWLYSPDEFDSQNLPYPASSWQSSDFVRAIEQLTLKDDTGDIVRPAFDDFFEADMVRSFIGQSLYTNNPQGIQLALTESVADALMPLSQLERGQYMGGASQTTSLPFQLAPVSSVLNQITRTDRQVSLLPGDKAASFAYALAVSSGTQQPDGAYQLVQYLLRQPDFVERMPGDIAAVESVPDNLSTWLAANRERLLPETSTTLETAEQRLITRSDTLFVNQAIGAVATIARIPDANSSQMNAALAEVEQQIEQTLAAATEAGNRLSVVVAEPTPAPQLADGETAMTFGIGMLSDAVANRAQWDSLAASFVDTSETVGAINLEFSNQGVTTLTQQTDCFYSPSLQVGNVPPNRQTGILPIEPLAATAADFDEADYVPDVLAQVSQNDQLQVWPMTITPTVLTVDAGQLSRPLANELAVTPSVDSFVITLDELQSATGDDTSAVIATAGTVPDDVLLLLLTAAYGGLPVDITTDPVSLRFDEPQTINALQNVMSLIEENYIAYPRRTSSGTAVLQPRPLNQVNPAEQTFPTVFNFPQGSQYTPVSYRVGGFAISERTAIPERCFQWIQFLSQHPELFNTMPAQQSMLDDPAFLQTVDDDRLAFYRQYNALLQSDNVVNINTNTLEGWFIGAFVYRIIFRQALQAHLEDNTPLPDVMRRAQSEAMQYRACVEPFKEREIPVELSNQEAIDLLTPLAECAVSVNPEFEAFFPFL